MTPAHARPLPRAVPVEPVVNPLQEAGFWLAAVFIFFVFSAAMDLMKFFHPARPMLFMGIFGLIIVGINQRLVPVVQTRIARSLLLFSAWLVACVPFSDWRGGSFQILVEDWQKSLMCFFLAAGLIVTTRHVNKTLHAIAYGGICLAIFALYFNSYVMGRLMLPATRYSNPNDLAAVLLTALPFIGMLVVETGGLRRAIGLAGIPLVLFCILKTGSRAGMLGIGVLILAVLAHVPGKYKAMMVVIAPVAALLALLVLPTEVKQRYFTFFSADPEAEVTNEDIAAINSAHSRWSLLKDSLYLTATNPIAGVGPGMFPVAQNTLAVSRGAPKGSWHVTHNTYTQISSETGIPGLLFYMGVIVYCLKGLKSVMRTTADAALKRMVVTCRIALLTFCAVAFFGSFGYMVNLPLLSGIIVALLISSQSMVRAPAAPLWGPQVRLRTASPAWRTPAATVR
jgi:O-antigen ligase